MKLNQKPSIACLLIAMVACQAGLYAQSYENLVFEGAGIRGVAYVGAIKELEQQGVLPGVCKVGGTSAGAIAALALSLGYNADEIEKIIYDTNLQEFNDGGFSVIGGVHRMSKRYGWYKGKAVTGWIGDIIEAKTGYADITFRELHARNFKDLYVTGTSLNHQRLIVFSHETYPDMKVKDAVRISMSIPLYFEAVCIDARGQVIDVEKATGYYDIMVDGGFTGNFPIFIFDPLENINGMGLRMCNASTLGLRIDTPEQITYDREQRGLAPRRINGLARYMSAFYTYALENLNRNSLTPADWERTVSISSGNIGPRIRKLSVEEKELLITNGQTAMKDYLEAR